MTAQYRIEKVTQHFVLISDQGVGRSVTNDAVNVITTLTEDLGGLGARRVIYRDTMGRFDELKHRGGRFEQFSPCTASQQSFFAGLMNSPT